MPPTEPRRAVHFRFRRLLARGAAALHWFRHNQRGSMATTFALSLIPITMSVGAAVDYSVANKARTGFNGAADAAALAAVSKTGMATNSKAAQQTALNIFNSYAATVTRATIKSVKATVRTTRQPGARRL